MEVMGRVGVRDWVEEQRRLKWKWAGHVARRLDNRWTNKVLFWQPAGQRQQGRPQTRWEDTIKQFLSARFQDGIDTQTWTELAQDRAGWGLWEADFASMAGRGG